MEKRTGIFAGDDPFQIAGSWLREAEKCEINDHNAIALATVDGQGMPNARMVLLKDIEVNAFVFYTNYNSQKGQEIDTAGKVAFVIHWKSLRRQIRVRGLVEKENGSIADDYFASRSLQSRIGAWASPQSEPLESRQQLMKEVAKQTAQKGMNPKRPPHWGGFRVLPLEIEFWSDGEFRLHDRFQWRRKAVLESWVVQRLAP